MTDPRKRAIPFSPRHLREICREARRQGVSVSALVQRAVAIALPKLKQMRSAQ